MQQRLARDLRDDQPGKRLPVNTPGERRTDLAIGETCRTLRQQAGLSLSQMSRLTHRDTSTLSRFERGHTNPRDVDELVRAYRQFAAPVVQQRPQRSDRPRMWPLVYLAVSPLVLLPTVIVSADHLNDNIMRAWVILSLALIVASIVPTVVRDLRTKRHPAAIIARASYLFALTLIVTFNVLRWEESASPLTIFQGLLVVGLGLLTVAYDRLEREKPPAG